MYNLRMVLTMGVIVEVFVNLADINTIVSYTEIFMNIFLTN